jgi:rare lipoprotein A (peptidoglycan hydrolase)
MLLPILSVILLSPGMARSQPVEENPAGFLERWTIPGARAAEPIVPPEAQTPSPSPPPDDHIGQPDSAAATPAMRSQARKFRGKASFYAYTRGKTASGTPHDPNALTAAHRTLPFGTRLRVTDIKTRKSVVVVVNDRGPAIHSRAIDLTRGAAEVLGMTGRGVAQVSVEVVTDTN